MINIFKMYFIIDLKEDLSNIKQYIKISCIYSYDFL